MPMIYIQHGLDEVILNVEHGLKFGLVERAVTVNNLVDHCSDLNLVTVDIFFVFFLNHRLTLLRLQFVIDELLHEDVFHLLINGRPSLLIIIETVFDKVAQLI